MLKHPLVNIPHDKRYMVCSHKNVLVYPMSSIICICVVMIMSVVHAFLFFFGRPDLLLLLTCSPDIILPLSFLEYTYIYNLKHNRNIITVKNIDVTAHTSVLVMFVPLITLNIVHHDSQHWINQYNQYKYMKTIKLNFKNLEYDINRSVL